MAEKKKSGGILKPLQIIIVIAVIMGVVILLALKTVLPNTSIKTYATSVSFLSFLLSLSGYLIYNTISKNRSRKKRGND